MAMDRWNPFREMLALREAMDRMFDDNFVRSSMSGSRTSTFPVDLAETDQGFLLRATLPGVKPDDVQITIHGDTLTIRGQSTSQEERKEQNWLIREQRSGAFHRMVTLPAPVDPDQAEARFQDGILELTLPKAERARPRQIRVGGVTSGANTVMTESERTSGSTDAGESRPAQSPGAQDGGGVAQTPEVDADAGAQTSAPPPSPVSSPVPDGAPSTPPGKDPVVESSEESMGTSDPPSWTRERT